MTLSPLARIIFGVIEGGEYHSGNSEWGLLAAMKEIAPILRKQGAVDELVRQCDEWERSGCVPTATQLLKMRARAAEFTSQLEALRGAK